MVRRIFSFLLAVCLLISLVPPVARGEAAETPDGMVSSQALIDKMKAREGFSATPYWDYSHYSIGYGTTCPSDKVSYYKKNPMTQEAAEAEFKKHLAEFELDVNDFAAKYNLTLKQHQFDALVSFSYNCGSSWMSSTSGYFNTAVRQGDTGAALLYGMALYSTAGGQYILIGRRLWEANMYINGDYGEGEKGAYPDNYRWVFLDGNGGTVRYKICAFDTKYKAQLPEAFDDIPVGTDKDGKSFVYEFAGWYTAQGKKVTKLDGNLSAGQELYARWTDPEGNFRADETLPAFPINATANTAANIRKGPGTGYDKNGKLEKGQAVKVREEKSGTEVSGTTTWCRIGTDKWVTKAYLDYQYPGAEGDTAEFPKTGKVVNVTASVNVRKGPGTDYEKNGKLEKGAKVTVTEEATGTSHTIAGVTTDIWCKVGEEQWVCKGYISYIGADGKPIDDGGTKLKSLKIVKEPTQLSFVQPIVEPDWEGSVLLATYQNGYQKAFTVTRSMVSDFDGSQLGEQTVNATYGGKSVSITVNVGAIKAVSKLAGVMTENNSITLSWKKAAGATHYYVYYRKVGAKSFTRAGTTTATSYTVPKLEVNAEYQFCVYSYNIFEGNRIKGPASEVISLLVNAKMTAPQGLQAVQTNNGEVTLSWKASANATHYNVYYRLAEDTAYTKAGSTKKASYTVTDLVPNGTYTFRVISYYKDDAGNTKGFKADVRQKLTVQVAAPTAVKATLVGHDDVKLTWKAAKGANRYYVHYRKKGAKSYKRAAITSKTSYTIKDLADNTAYEFRVYSYLDSYKGKPSGAVTLSTTRNLSAPQKVTVQLYGYDDAKITWSKVKYATAYRVYYKRSDKKSYTYLGQYTGTSAKKANLSDGYKYYFKVVPVIAVNGGYYKDDSYKTASVTTLKKVSKPKVTKYSSSKVKVSWTDISGETGYQIGVYSDKACTKKVSITTATGKSKTISVKKGKTYYYKVRAYKTVGSKKYYAPWSSVVSFKLK